MLKLAFFENNAKDKRYNRHTRFVSCDIVVSAYIGLWFPQVSVLFVWSQPVLIQVLWELAFDCRLCGAGFLVLIRNTFPLFN